MLSKFSIVLGSFLLLFAVNSFSQGFFQDSLFSDFDAAIQKPIKPVADKPTGNFKKYLRYPKSNIKRNNRIEFVEFCNDTLWGRRKASVINSNGGLMIAFDMMKTTGYEKVLIFGDKDYYYDTLLILKDTFIFKEMMDNDVLLLMVYPVKDDTLIVKYGNRLTRYDFLKKFSFRPAMKDYLSWFSNPYLDYVDTYTLVKQDNAYELIKIETSQESVSEYDYKRLKEKFTQCGLSPFWMALVKLTL